MAFLKIAGYHWNVDSRDPFIIQILAKIWLVILLSFAAVGDFYLIFVVGISHINALVKQTKEQSGTIVEFTSCGFILAQFVVPILHTTSLIYGSYAVNLQLSFYNIISNFRFL